MQPGLARYSRRLEPRWTADQSNAATARNRARNTEADAFTAPILPGGRPAARERTSAA